MKKMLLFSAIIMACVLLLTDRAYAQAPDWTPTPGLQYNMQIVGRLQLTVGPDTYSTNANDLVGAFVDDVSRGVASPQDVPDRVYLSIGSNSISGDTITLQAYIALEDTIYAVDLYEGDGTTKVDFLIFNSGQILGSWALPYIFRLSDNSHDVTFNITPADGSGGFVEANGIEYDTDGDEVSVIDGNDLILTFVPEVGYHVQTVSFGVTNVFTFPADTDLLQPNGTFIDTLENVEAAVTVTVVYALNEYRLVYYAGPNGKLSWDDPNDAPDGGVLTGLDSIVQTVTHGGDAVEVIAVPGLTYVFYLWSDGEILATRVDEDVADIISVTALFVPTGWTPGSNYQYSMTIVGNLYIDGNLSENEYDLVAAFVDTDPDPAVETLECRGIASPDPNFDGLVFLNIGSNDGSFEEVILKILDSETGAICSAGGNIDFVSNLQLGTLENPYTIACEVDLALPFDAGFTWFSANVDIGDWLVDNYFHPDYFGLVKPVLDDRIIGQTSFALHSGIEWVGGLSVINPKSMYRYRGTALKTLSIAGAPVSLTPINLFAGFTWLGYLPQEILNVNDALDDITPAPTANDRIIGQTTFAIYSGTSWIGSLTEMRPGEGYIIKLTNASVLNYPAPTSNGLKSNEITKQPVVSPIGLEPKANMKNTMTVLGKLELNAQEHSLNQNDVVYAFIDGEVRGMATPTENDGLIFLSIGDNNEEAKPVVFKVWVDNLQQLFDVQGSLAYEALGEAGSLNDPYIFKLDATSKTDISLSIGQPYPNPFNDQTMIPFSLNKAGQVNVKVYNSIGQLVKSVTESKNSAGTHSIAIERETLQTGMYFYVIRVDNNQQTGTLIIN